MKHLSNPAAEATAQQLPEQIYFCGEESGNKITWTMFQGDIWGGSRCLPLEERKRYVVGWEERALHQEASHFSGLCFCNSFFFMYRSLHFYLSIYLSTYLPTYLWRDQNPRAGAILSDNPERSDLPQCQKMLVTAAKRGTRFDGNITGAGRCVPNDNDAAKFWKRSVWWKVTAMKE